MQLAERSDRPVMWLAPHFMALDVAGASVLLFQKRKGISIYQRQSNAVMDRALRRGRLRLGNAEIFSRDDAGRALFRAIRRGDGFFNLPDMDFGTRDAAFVPFFGVPAATLLAPSRMARALDMIVQPVVAEILPGGAGYLVRFEAPWPDFPTDDAVADAAQMNRWIESRDPAQPGAVPVGASPLQDAPARRAGVVLRSARRRDNHRQCVFASPRCRAPATTSSCSTRRAIRSPSTTPS